MNRPFEQSQGLFAVLRFDLALLRNLTLRTFPSHAAGMATALQNEAILPAPLRAGGFSPERPGVVACILQEES